MVLILGTNLRRRTHAAVPPVTIFFLFAAPIFLIALVFAFNAAYLAEAKANLHTSADAAALAAVQSLVDDSWLTQDPTLQMNLVTSARTQAQAYASVNKVLGKPLNLQLPTTATANPPDGDIVFAFLDQPRKPRSHASAFCWSAIWMAPTTAGLSCP